MIPPIRPVVTAVIASIVSIAPILAEETEVHVVNLAAIPEIPPETYFSDAPFDEGAIVADSQVPAFPKFNPAKGTLTGVTIEATGTISYQVFLESEGILEGSQPHFASAGSLASLDVRLVSDFTNTRSLTAFGNSINLGVGCEGNPGDGDACFDMLDGDEPLDFSVFNEDAFVGSGTFDNLLLEVSYPVWMSFELINVATAFTDLTFSVTPVELTITYTYEPPLEAEVEFTGPKQGTFTVPSETGKQYNLRRATSLEAATSSVIDTKPGSGAPLEFDFDDSADPSADSAFFWVEEIDAP